MKGFLESNVLLYLVGQQNNSKKKLAKALIKPGFTISTQVVAENVNVCLKKFKIGKEMAFDHGRNLMNSFEITTIRPSTIEKSFLISQTYKLGFWDSLIIAAALESGCDVLYSEDLQHGLLIENTLTIIDPFKTNS